ncbi:hypothetical protein CALVIDRAFT_275690 [Calocera viscosa TUFC12733]|uniref:Uncharacterized protein n=1 Tax=Calocera viscosa (strain TUFC12733) TaxID=1330018 RepID=A0A167R0I8_CALVF|nr:hypothetical protein CALVIDRAFT_275690 [Calocera viscosa TUFC12733]
MHCMYCTVHCNVNWKTRVGMNEWAREARPPGTRPDRRARPRSDGRARHAPAALRVCPRLAGTVARRLSPPLGHALDTGPRSSILPLPITSSLLTAVPFLVVTSRNSKTSYTKQAASTRTDEHSRAARPPGHITHHTTPSHLLCTSRPPDASHTPARPQPTTAHLLLIPTSTAQCSRPT